MLAGQSPLRAGLGCRLDGTKSSPRLTSADAAAAGAAAAGVASAVAVVGTVLGSAFVVLSKLVRKVATSEEEAESLLPPL